MTISKGKVVSIDYTLKNESGETIESSIGHKPLTYLHGYGNIIPGLESALEGKIINSSLSVTIEPKEAYGEYKKDLIIQVEKSQFDNFDQIEPGMQVELQSNDNEEEQGHNHGQIFTISEVSDEEVTLDGNHPMAGQTLNFEVTVQNIREATAEEISHRHVH